MTVPSLPIAGPAGPSAADVASRVMQVLEGYLAELERGVPPDPEQLVARHPELAEPLKEYLAAWSSCTGRR